MFKRKLFKRALPFILSVAMMFESLPATAMATESSGAEQMTETEALDEEGGESGSEKESGSEEKSEPVSASEAEAESGSSEEEVKSLPESESGSEPKSEEKSELESKTAETVESSNVDASESSTTEKTTEEVKTETVTTEETTETADINPAASDLDETKDYATELRLAEAVKKELKVGDTKAEYQYVLEGEGEAQSWKYTTEYAKPATFGDFEKKLKEGENGKGIEVVVDNGNTSKTESLDRSIAERLEFKWYLGDTELKFDDKDKVPEAGNTYRLKITLTKAVADELNILMPKDGKEISEDVYVEVTKAKLTSNVASGSKLLKIAPGKTVKDLKDQIQRQYNLQYSNGRDFEIDKEKVTLNVYVHQSDTAHDEGAAPETWALADDYKLNTGEEYIAHIVITPDESTAKNYEFPAKDQYNVEVEDLQNTAVRLTYASEADKALGKVYDSAAPAADALNGITAKVWTVDDGGNNKEATELATLTAENAGWYRMERVPAPRTEEDDGKGNKKDVDRKTFGEDQITDEYIIYKDPSYVANPDGTEVGGTIAKYVKVEAPVDAGDYYVIWKYAEPEGKAYKTSVSEPVSYTITTAPIVISLTDDGTALAGKIKEGMTKTEIDKVLATLDYKINAVTKTDDGKAALGTEIAKTDEFFGIDYRADDGKSRMYYRPIFMIERSIIEEKIDDKWTTVDEKQRTWDAFVEGDKYTLEDDSHRYVYRVKISGKKGLFYQGDILRDENDDPIEIEITDLSANSANTNYRVDVDANEQFATEIARQAGKKTVIDTSAIVSTFETGYKDKGDGSESKPLTKVYDEKALYATRAAYKQAKAGEGAPAGELTYRWKEADIAEYKEWLALSDKEKEEKPFPEHMNWVEGQGGIPGTTDDEGQFAYTWKANKIYALEITYKDPSHEYYAESAYVYYKVEPQHIVIVPAEQTAQKGQNIDNWLSTGANKADYEIRLIPNNDFEAYKSATDKSQYKVDAIYKTPDPHRKDSITSFEWVVMQAPKGTTEWADAYTSAAFDPDVYDYVLTARYLEYGKDEETDTPDKSKIVPTNYTSLQDASVEQDERQYFDDPAKIDVKDRLSLYAKIDAAEIAKLTKIYDGTAIDLTKIDWAKAVELYTDAAMTKPADKNKIDINTGAEYDANKVNVYWAKGNITDGTPDTGVKLYTTPNTLWGGDYTLVLQFAGNEEYNPLSTRDNNGDTVDDPNGVKYSEWYYTDAKFAIKKAKLTLTPEIKSADQLKAGDKLSDILLKSIVAEGAVAKDQDYFTYRELQSGVLDGTYAYMYKTDRSGNLKWMSYAEVEDDSFDLDKDGNKVRKSVKDDYHYYIGKNGGYPALSKDSKEDSEKYDKLFTYQIDDKGEKTPWDGTDKKYLRFGRKYTVNLEANALIGPLDDSYDVEYKAASVTITQRGQGEVKAADENTTTNVIVTPLTYEYANNVYTIRPREAVKFYYDGKNGKKNSDGTDMKIAATVKDDTFDSNFTGNLIEYRIFAPMEFLNSDKDVENFIYETAIKEAGGYIVSENTADSINKVWKKEYKDATKKEQIGYSMTVLFPLAEDDKKKSFKITWEDGYTDTFEFSDDIQLEADLKQAVAPKSIKFNNVKTKMAVGDTQQLDLKITKKQLADVIKVQYRIAGGGTSNGFISIDPDTGVVTALKVNKKATQIEAYPVKVGKNGKYEEITGKGVVKPAKAKIAVTDLKAPSIKKIAVHDTYADVSFTDVGSGYRREIYVMEGKRKAADFNTPISNLDKQTYKEAGLAVEPKSTKATAEYPDIKDDGKYESDTKLVKVPVGTKSRNGKTENNYDDQLVPGRTYTVYVRNVSAPRTLDDGSVVDFVAKGNVKTFKVTKSQVAQLDAYFNVGTDNTPIAKVNAKYLVTDHEIDGTTEVYKERVVFGEPVSYEVPLSAKTAQVSVAGRFWEDYDGANNNAEAYDKLGYNLPLTKALQANYQNPKLVYGIADENVADIKNIYNGKKFTSKSKYATINNKGKITLKGTGLNGEAKVYIYVWDSISGESDSVPLTIKSDVTTVTGKKGKLSVGQIAPLANFLDYKNGKKKVSNYVSDGITITDDMIARAKEQGFEIVDGRTLYDMKPNDEIEQWIKVKISSDYDEYNFNVTDSWLESNRHFWFVRAVEPNKKLTLEFKDMRADGTEISVLKPVTLTSTPLQTVKSLKVSYVDDQHITINFKDAGSPEGYEIALLDSSKKVIEKKYIPADEYDYVASSESQNLQNYQNWIVLSDSTKYNNDVTDKVQNSYGEDQETHYVKFAHPLVYFEKTKTFAYTFDSDKILRRSAYTVNVTPVYGSQMPKKTAVKKVKTTDIPAARLHNVDVLNKDIQSAGVGIQYAVQKQSQAAEDTNQNPTDPNFNSKTWNLSKNPYFQAGNVYTLTLGGVNLDAKDRVTDTLTWKSSNTKVATIKSRPGTYTATFKPLKSGTTIITVKSKITKKTIAKQIVRVKAIGNGEGYGGDYEPAGEDTFFKDFLAVWDPFYEGRLEVLSSASKLKLRLQAYDRAWVSFTAPAYGQYNFSADRGDVTVYDAKNGKPFSNKLLFLEANQKVYILVEATQGGEYTVSADTSSFARLTTANNHPDNALTVTPEVVDGSKEAWVAFTAPEDNFYRFGAITGKKDAKTGEYTSASNSLQYSKDNKTEMFEKDCKIQLKYNDNKPYEFPMKELYLKAGTTIYLKVTDNVKLFVQCAAAADNTINVTTNTKGTLKFKDDETMQYIRFTAPKSGKYRFDIEGDRVLVKSCKVYINSAEIEDEDKDGVYAVKAAAVNAGESTTVTEKPTDKIKKTIFVQIPKDQTVMIGFSGRAEKTKDDGTKETDADGKQLYVDTEVTVTVIPDEGNYAPIKLDEKVTVTKATEEGTDPNKTTINTIKLNTFVIPAAADKAKKYTVKQTAKDLTKFSIKYYEAETGKELTLTDNSFVVKTDNTVSGFSDKTVKPGMTGVTIKPGMTIIIEATNSSTTDDAEYTITEVKAIDLNKESNNSKSVDITGDSFGQWFTFTAPKAGKYEFKPTLPEKTEDQKHDASLKAYKALFDTDNEVPLINDTADLKANEMVVLYLEGTKKDTTTEADAKTSVTVSAKELTVKAIGEGADQEITVPKNSTLYYTFTAPKNDTYTFKWVPESSTANVTCTVKFGDKTITNGGSTELQKGNVVDITFISTDAADQKGKLTISSQNAESITTGQLTPIAADKEKTVTKSYTFTAANRPDHNAGDKIEYSLIVTKADNATKGEKLSVQVDGVKDDDGNNIDIECTDEDVQFFKLKEGQTVTITTTATGNATEAVSGYNFKIELTTPAEPTKELTAKNVSEEVKVTRGENKLYKYTAPEYGIYDINVAGKETDGSIEATVYDNKDLKTSKASLVLLKKGEIRYIVVKSGATTLKEQSGNLNINKLEPTAIKAESETTVTVPKNGKIYYEFTAEEYGHYNFSKPAAPAAQSDGDVDIIVYKQKSTGLVKENSISKVTADVGDKYLVMFNASKSSTEVKIEKYKIIKTAVNVLKIGGDPTSVKVEAATTDKSVTFGFKPITKDKYAFKVTNGTYSGSNMKFNGTTKDGSYFVVEYTDADLNKWQEFTVTATPEEGKDVTVSMSVAKAEIKELTADKQETFEIEPGECKFAQFVPTARARYNLVNDNDKVTATLVDDKDNMSDIDNAVLNSGDKKIIELTAGNYDATTNKDKQTAKITVETVKPSKEITATEAISSPKAGKSVWYTFKAPDDGKYIFEVQSKGEGDEAKWSPLAGSTIEQFKDMNSDSGKKPVGTEYMKKGDTILIKVKLGNPIGEKDSVQLAVTPTKADAGYFKTVSFEENAVTDHESTQTFTLKKGESYNVVYVLKDSTKSAPTVTYTCKYQDADKKNHETGDSLTAGKPEKFDNTGVTKDSDATVEVKVTLDKDAAADVYIFVEKLPQPEQATN